MSLSVWLGFFLASILIAVTPGPGAVLSMSNGLRYGYWAALRGILGLQTAILAHLLIVALGLGAVLAASQLAFDLMKFCGAAYLVWLGLDKWRAPVQKVDAEFNERAQGNLYRQGILVNLTNPKAVVFIAALVPHFIDASRAQLPQYLIVATTLCLTDMAVMSIYALAASRVSRWMSNDKAMQRQNRLFSGLFVLAGVLLVFSSRPSS